MDLLFELAVLLLRLIMTARGRVGARTNENLISYETSYTTYLLEEGVGRSLQIYRLKIKSPLAGINSGNSSNAKEITTFSWKTNSLVKISDFSTGPNAFIIMLVRNFEK